MLCLSVFTIITVIVKVGGGNTNDGQIDSSWVIFWLQMEAAVAVMVASIIAYRALFVVERSRTPESPRYISWVRTKTWDRSKDSQENPPVAHQSNPSDRGSLSFRNRQGYLRRSKSARKQNSPSYQDGAVPRLVGYNLNENTALGFRPPLTSCGYPITGLPIALDDAGNHQHGGLTPEEQQQIRTRHNCSHSTTIFPEPLHQHSQEYKPPCSGRFTTSSRSEGLGLQRSSELAEHSRDLNQVTYL